MSIDFFLLKDRRPLGKCVLLPSGNIGFVYAERVDKLIPEIMSMEGRAKLRNSREKLIVDEHGDTFTWAQFANDVLAQCDDVVVSPNQLDLN